MQDPNFALFTQTPLDVPLITGVAGYRDGNFNEQSSVTRYPVESGSSLSDNIVREPARVRLDGNVSNLLATDITEANVVWQHIKRLMVRATLLEVITPLGNYKNMAITRATTKIDARSSQGLRFSLELLEVQIVGQASGLQTTAETNDKLISEDTGIRTLAPLSTINDELSNIDNDVLLIRDTFPGSFAITNEVAGLQNDIKNVREEVTGIKGKIEKVREAFKKAEEKIEKIEAYAYEAQARISQVRNTINSIQRAIQRPLATSNLLNITLRQALNLSNEARETFRININNYILQIVNWWQLSDESWNMSIRKSDGSSLVSGVRLANETDVLADVLDIPGSLTVKGKDEPTRESWTNEDEHYLEYMP